MINTALQPLLQHPDITFDKPAYNAVEVLDAATDETLAWVKKYDQNGVEDAILRSEIAQKTWKKQTALQRADILWQWYTLLLNHKNDLAEILTAEQGKPLAEAQGEIAYAASFVRWFA